MSGQESRGMAPINQLIFELTYDIQVGYALYSDVDAAVAYATRHENLLRIEPPFAHRILAEAVKNAAIMLAFWKLPQAEFEEICQRLGAVVQTLLGMIDNCKGSKED